MSFDYDYLGLLGLVAVILAAVFIFFLYSQRKLKANAQRIREEFGTPGERDLAIAQLSESATESNRWDSSQAGSPDELAAQLDDKIAQANAAIRAADQQIARLEAVIERARQIGH